MIVIICLKIYYYNNDIVRGRGIVYFQVKPQKKISTYKFFPEEIAIWFSSQPLISGFTCSVAPGYSFICAFSYSFVLTGMNNWWSKMGREMKKLIKCQWQAFYLKYYLSFQLIWFIIPISTIIHDIHGHMIGEGFSLNCWIQTSG